MLPPEEHAAAAARRLDEEGLANPSAAAGPRVEAVIATAIRCAVREALADERRATTRRRLAEAVAALVADWDREE